MPWNFPYYQVARFAGPNLMVGNTILLKHAPQCPESALAMEQLFRDAGLTSDDYVNIFARTSRSPTSSPTHGSGRLGHRQRARGYRGGRTRRPHLKKVVLELGGSDAFIVLDTD